MHKTYPYQRSASVTFRVPKLIDAEALVVSERGAPEDEARVVPPRHPPSLPAMPRSGPAPPPHPLSASHLPCTSLTPRSLAHALAPRAPCHA